MGGFNAAPLRRLSLSCVVPTVHSIDVTNLGDTCVVHAGVSIDEFVPVGDALPSGDARRFWDGPRQLDMSNSGHLNASIWLLHCRPVGA